MSRVWRETCSTPAQFPSLLPSLFSEHFSAEEDMAVREESDKYLASIVEQQTWLGNEPALQLLLLPLGDSFTLPKYSPEPDYLSPMHCRLCLSSYEVGCEEQHLQECSQCTTTEYRRMVLRKVLEEWPQRIPAQVLRSRLAAFKLELCDANFEELPCASCCRLKRRCKLSDVIFRLQTLTSRRHG